MKVIKMKMKINNNKKNLLLKVYYNNFLALALSNFLFQKKKLIQEILQEKDKGLRLNF